MKTRAPRDCSIATATGWAPKRAPSARTHAPTASGLCSISPRSRPPPFAGCSDQACLLSPQSIARKAASRVLVVRTASENLVLETQQLPLLETLLENIECWPVVLVAAGGLLIP